jgi:hypothetical protein
MPISVELGGVIAAILAIVLATATVTRKWDRTTLRMDQIERDLLQLRERVIHLERSNEAARRT